MKIPYDILEQSLAYLVQDIVARWRRDPAGNHRSPNVDTLLSCSCVSSEWKLPAQILLGRTVRIKSESAARRITQRPFVDDVEEVPLRPRELFLCNMLKDPISETRFKDLLARTGTVKSLSCQNIDFGEGWDFSRLVGIESEWPFGITGEIEFVRCLILSVSDLRNLSLSKCREAPSDLEKVEGDEIRADLGQSFFFFERHRREEKTKTHAQVQNDTRNQKSRA